jgi:aminoglycoside 6'-N-acetyltransferase I
MHSVQIRLAVPADSPQLSRLLEALWPEAPAAEHARDIAPILAGAPLGTLPLVIFVAEESGGVLQGFLEVGLRSHADGCDPRLPVGFVEGWFVIESHRAQGVGARLLAVAEDWARSHGCVEMASDTWLDNEVSQRVHEALKFDVVDRCVHYRKAL